jgi:hypothetical protein
VAPAMTQYATRLLLPAYRAGSLFEEFGFVRDRRIAKWRWVMRLRVSA